MENKEKLEIIKKEIEFVLNRNKNEEYLKSILIRALILENLMKN